MNTARQVEDNATSEAIATLPSKNLFSKHSAQRRKKRGLRGHDSNCYASETQCSRPVCRSRKIGQRRGLAANKVVRALKPALAAAPHTVAIGKRLNVAEALARHFYNMGGSEDRRPSVDKLFLAKIIWDAGQYVEEPKPSNVRNYIAQLITYGLLERVPHPDDGRKHLFVWLGPLADEDSKVAPNKWRIIMQNFASKAAIKAKSAKIDRNTIVLASDSASDLAFDSKKSVSETAFETAVIPAKVPNGWQTGQPWAKLHAKRCRAKLPCVGKDEALEIADAFDAELAAPDAPKPAPPPEPSPPPQASEAKAVGLKGPQKAKAEPKPTAEPFNVVAAIQRLARLAKEQEACPIYQAKQRAEADRVAQYEAACAEIDAKQAQRAARRAAEARASSGAMPADAGGLASVACRPPPKPASTSRAIDPTIVPFLRDHGAKILGPVDARYWARPGLTREHVRWALESVASKIKRHRVGNPSGMVLSAATRLRDGRWQAT